MKGYCVNLPVFISITCASVHNRTGSCHFEVACDVAFLLHNTVCAAGLRFRSGRAPFKANRLGRVLGHTSRLGLVMVWSSGNWTAAV